MQDIKAIIPAKEKWCSIVWQVNDWCNFRCSYCNEWNWAGRNKNEEPDEIATIVDTLERIIDQYQAKGYRYFKLFLSGGEPTFWKGLIPVVNTFREKVEWPGSCVGINTNFSKSLDWWKEHHHLFEDIVATYHPEFSKEKQYIEKYQFLQDKKNYLCSRVMMQKENFQQCIDFSEKLKSECKNYIIEYAPVYDEMKPSSEPYHYEEQWHIDWLKNNSFEQQQKIPVKKQKNYSYARMWLEDDSIVPIRTNDIIVYEKNFFKGWYCNIHESLHIHPNGNITQASCGVGPTVGNIKRGEFDQTSTEGVWCPKNHCHCAADFNISKSRPEHVNKIR